MILQASLAKVPINPDATPVNDAHGSRCGGCSGHAGHFIKDGRLWLWCAKCKRRWRWHSDTCTALFAFAPTAEHFDNVISQWPDATPTGWEDRVGPEWPSAAPSMPSARGRLVVQPACHPSSLNEQKPWQGACDPKPWQYLATAVIPHRDTPDHLELCLRFLEQQTERPYVMVIDTGSGDAALQRVLALRSDGVEVHQIACHGTPDYVDRVCYAMDLGMSACRTEYLWCLHSDCFIINPNLLRELLAKAEGDKHPVIGYESVSAHKHAECKGMVSHTCTLLHMPTMHQLDVSWSRSRLESRAKAAGRNVVFDAEMALNYRLRDRQVTPLILGPEQPEGVERDANRVHLRSGTLGEQLKAALPGSTNGTEGVLKELATMAPHRSPTRARSIRILNLIYHVWPVAANDIWRWNVSQLLRRMHLFNGRKVIAVATGHDTLPASAVREAFHGYDITIIEKPNDPALREAATFVELLESVETTDPTQATFYAHAKGVSRPESMVAETKWADCMYHHCLDDENTIRIVLATKAMLGVSFDIDTRWIYPGTFWWFHNASLFCRNDWRFLENRISDEGTGWSVEAFPNRFFPNDCERIYPSLRYASRNGGALYDPRTWLSGHVEPSCHDSTKSRWRHASEIEGITWGLRLSGDTALDAVLIESSLNGRRIIEFGCGYGRLPESIVKRGVRVRAYTGIDISASRIHKLQEQFTQFRFINADVEDISLELSMGCADIVAAFLTFKHLYPDFGKAARHAHMLLAPGGHLIFDVPEPGNGAPAAEGVIEQSTGIYLRSYARETVNDLLEASGFAVVSYGTILHTPDRSRLLVCARKK